jgi:uncharacterized protein YhaN
MASRLHIAEIEVDAFGRLAKASYCLQPGLNVLFGQNESGKSTLQAFLKFMLFGFSKRAVAQRYEPLHQATLGGRLLLKSEGQSVVVRRTVGKKTKVQGDLMLSDESGNPLLPSLLPGLLGHVSESLFGEVFSVSLDELQQFSRLTEEASLSQAFLSAGLAGARRLPAVQALFQQEAEAIFTPRGTKPLLNQALDSLQEVRNQLSAVEARPALYLTVETALEDGEEKLNVLSAQHAALQRQLQHDQALLDGMDVVTQALALEQELGDIETVEPLDGAAVIEERAQEARRSEDERLALEASLKSLERERETLRAQLAPQDDLALAEAALQKRRSFEPELQRMALAQSQLSALKEQQKRRGAETGIDESRLTAVLVTQQHIHQLEALQAEAAALAPMLASSTQREATLSERRRELEHERSALVLELEALNPADLEALNRKREALRQLPTKQARVEQCTLNVQALEAAPPAVQEALPALSMRPSVWFLLLWLAIVPLVWLKPQYWIETSVLVLILVPLWWWWVWQRHAMARQSRDEVDQRNAVLAQRAAEWSERLRQAQAALSQQTDEVQALRRRADIEPERDVQSALEELEQLLAREKERAKKDEVLKRVASDLRYVDAECAAELQRQQALEQQRRQLDDRAQHLVAPFGLVMGPSLAATVEVMREVAELQKVKAEVESLSASVESTLQAQAEIARSMEDLVVRLGLKRPRPEDGAVVALSQFVATQHQCADALKRKDERLHERSEALQQQTARSASAQARVNEILEKAQVDSVEAFLTESARRAALFSKQQHIAELKRIAEGKTGQSFEQLRSVVTQHAVTVDSVVLLEKQLAELGQALEQQQREQGANRQRLSQWAQDDTRRMLRQREETLNLEIEQLVQRYVVSGTAAAALAFVRQQFENAHQPRLVERAASIFAQLTVQRYRRIVLEPTGKQVSVFDADGVKWSIELLSRGTRELLLLAFRMAVAAEFGETHTALPLILDDVAVNLDAQRQASFFSQLRNMQAPHQVLFLTCHAPVRERLAEHGANVVLL